MDSCFGSLGKSDLALADFASDLAATLGLKDAEMSEAYEATGARQKGFWEAAGASTISAAGLLCWEAVRVGHLVLTFAAKVYGDGRSLAYCASRNNERTEFDYAHLPSLAAIDDRARAH